MASAGARLPGSRAALTRAPRRSGVPQAPSPPALNPVPIVPGHSEPQLLPQAVHDARDQEHTWNQIGDLLGITATTAARRYRNNP